MYKLWMNGLIYSLNNENKTYSAMLTFNDKIIAVGSEKELIGINDSPVEIIDLKNHCVIPSFIDSHIHLIGHGDMLTKVDFSIYKEKRAVLNKIKEIAKQMSPSDWLIVEGWNEENFIDDPTKITKQDLDSLNLNVRVCAKRICRHCMTINSVGLNHLNIKSTDGIFYDEEQFKLLLQLEKRTKNSLKQSLYAAIDDLRKYGITEVHTEDLNYYGDALLTLEALEEVSKEKNFPMQLLVHHEAYSEIKSKNLKHFKNYSRIQLGAIKLFADGSLGAKTALLSHTYENENHQGEEVMSLDEIQEVIKVARKNHLPVAIHAIGDLAVQHVLTSIKKYPRTKETVGKDRLIHAQIINNHILTQYKDLDICVDLQPSFIGSDYPWLLNRIGKSRAAYAFAFKYMLNNGWGCSFSSDSPIDTVSPFEGIYYAVIREKNGVVYNADQCLSVLEAVKLYTQGAENSMQGEFKKGVLKAGNDANFLLLNKDIFKIKHEEITSLEVLATIFEGEFVYKKETVL